MHLKNEFRFNGFYSQRWQHISNGKVNQICVGFFLGKSTHALFHIGVTIDNSSNIALTFVPRTSLSLRPVAAIAAKVATSISSVLS